MSLRFKIISAMTNKTLFENMIYLPGACASTSNCKHSANLRWHINIPVIDINYHVKRAQKILHRRVHEFMYKNIVFRENVGFKGNIFDRHYLFERFLSRIS